MPKRDKPTEAFVERANPEATSRPQRISLKLNEDGSIDWDSASQKTRDRFAESVSQDATALEMIGLKAKAAEAEAGILKVTPEHVHMFLDMYATAEQFIIPRVIKAKSKGIIIITPEMAAASFGFTPEQKEQLGPCGAEWANATFPEWLMKFLLEIGPGARFFGLLGVITWSQTKTAMDMWKAQRSSNDAPVTAQPVNGKHVEPEVVPEGIITEPEK